MSKEFETEWEPVGPSRVQSLSISPVSYLQDKGFSLWTFLNTKEKIQTVTDQCIKGKQTQRRSIQITIVQPLKEDLGACSRSIPSQYL